MGPLAPVKTSQKKDGHHHGPQVLRVIRPPLGQISGSATGPTIQSPVVQISRLVM